MTRALVGHTGFVGSNLLAQAPFEATFNSRNVEELAGRRFELLVCAGAPAVKWKANREPEADRANLARLMDGLGRAQADHCVLVSTVDVYPEPVGVDEDTPIDPDACQPYGRHRLELERFCRDRFATTILRLPGLFGPGLRKNVIYDLIHDHRVEFIDPAGVFQFYDLSRLWGDVERVRGHGLPLVNVATEPVGVQAVARLIVGRELPPLEGGGDAARYDFRSRHAELLGGSRGYLYDRDEVLADLERFARGERARVP